KRSRDKSIILCEGYMDVISLHQAGFTNAAAPLGTAFTTGQAMLLKRYAQEVILAFDSDQAGVKAALRALPILRETGLRGKVLSMKPYKDPDELIKAEGREGFEKRLREAEPGRMFELYVLHDQYDQNNPESRTQFVKEMAKKLAEIEEEVERSAYVSAAANHFMVKEKDLSNLVNRYGLGYQFEKANQKYKREPETSQKAEARKTEQQTQPQKLLLTWLIEHPEIYPQVRKIICPDDFLLPLHHSVALMVFDQFDRGEERGGISVFHPPEIRAGPGAE
ncbi:MAG: toprim domain-containing protein, partial [Eubacterium sp.]|nr:toprim domain-containing protein [Eubacterium sp.]